MRQAQCSGDLGGENGEVASGVTDIGGLDPGVHCEHAEVTDSLAHLRDPLLDFGDQVCKLLKYGPLAVINTGGGDGRHDARQLLRGTTQILAF